MADWTIHVWSVKFFRLVEGQGGGGQATTSPSRTTTALRSSLRPFLPTSNGQLELLEPLEQVELDFSTIYIFTIYVVGK